MNISDIDKIKYNGIVLSGGGIRGICQLGSLHYIFSSVTNFEEIEYLAGTSVGSCICLLLVCGFTPLEIYEKILHLDKFFSPEDIDIAGFGKNFGVIHPNKLRSFLEECVMARFGYIPNLSVLFQQTKKKLYVSSANITKLREEIFSYENFPFISCVDAVMMSCGIPLLFPKETLDGCDYVDGGLVNNFPLSLIEGKASNVIGVLIQNSVEEHSSSDIFEYMYRLFTTALFARREKSDTKNKKIITINPSVKKLFCSSLDLETKQKLFIEGYKTTEKEFIAPILCPSRQREGTNYTGVS